ncbi:porin [Methylorubrum populi BJ001]|uniref:Porin n=2 Tax=Methylobacteriaceae TaxID=119045 RepID=B1Z847_METPB|nr:outer membrane beta-barrel protein [Methylorubrum populi]ACB79014.1 porin [Methylorubrum populi BJ001]PZP71423.1 MAG: porin family protein [Methylorubrum populi]
MTRRPMPPTQSGLFPGLFSGFLGCLLAGSACAADLPRRAAPPPPPLPPAFTWTGFYVGANAGYGFRGGSSRYSDATYGTVTESGGKGGFVGGGQIGYNYQITPGSGWVLGAEADLQATGFGRRGDGTVGATPYYGVAPSLDWYGTLRGRVGYAFDRWLVYGTGGFAYGGGSRSPYASAYPYTLPDTTRLGYAAGAGIEYALTDHVSVKVEGLYVDLGKQGTGTTVYDATVPAYYGTGRSESGFGVVRGGLNYRF